MKNTLKMTHVKENIIDFAEQDLIKIVGDAHEEGLLFESLSELLSEKQVAEKREIPIEEPVTHFDRKSLPELYNKYENNKYLISELRKNRPEILRDRTVYYSTSAVRRKTDKPYKLQATYSMAMANYEFQITKDEPEGYRYDWKYGRKVSYQNTSKTLTFIYFNIQKVEEGYDTQIVNRFYVVRNLLHPSKLPDQLRERIFRKLFPQIS